MLAAHGTSLRVAGDRDQQEWAINYVGLPGIQVTSLPRWGFKEAPYTAHFPDGNASVARLLVRSMIPQVAAGRTMDDIVSKPRGEPCTTEPLPP
jgi:hypothetical protein